MPPTLSAGIEPVTKQFLDTVNSATGPALYELSPSEARKVFDGLQANPGPMPAVDVEDRTVPGGPTGSVPVKILRPVGSTGVLPVVVYIHGAGWVCGGFASHERLVRELCVGTGAAVVFVDFTLSPEARYPVAIEQSYAATKWVAENAATIKVDPKRLAVAGDSVGGNMAIAVTLLAKERGGPALAFQLLFYPVTDAAFDTPSYREFATNHFLTREAMKWFWNQYTTNESDRTQITASRLRATVEQLKGLPPALVMCGEFDVLRDEGEAYAHKLIAAGVRTTALRFHGTIHDFVLLHAVKDTPATRGAMTHAIATLRAELGT